MSQLNRNVAAIAGNLVRDVELKTGASGKAFAKGTLAINDVRDNKNVDYVDFVVFGDTATNMAKITMKGSNVLIDGRLSVSEYTTKDGAKRKSTEVLGDTFQAITRRPKADGETAPAVDAMLEEVL